MQPDTPSILAVCLSKRLHGAAQCDSLVDILSAFSYEKKSRIPMQAILLTKPATSLYTANAYIAQVQQ